MLVYLKNVPSDIFEYDILWDNEKIFTTYVNAKSPVMVCVSPPKPPEYIASVNVMHKVEGRPATNPHTYKYDPLDPSKKGIFTDSLGFQQAISTAHTVLQSQLAPVTAPLGRYQILFTVVSDGIGTHVGQTEFKFCSGAEYCALNCTLNTASEEMAHLKDKVDDEKLSELDQKIQQLRGQLDLTASGQWSTFTSREGPELKRPPKTKGTPVSYAFIVGIDEYENHDLKHLQHAKDDAVALAELLDKLGFCIKLKLGKSATRKVIHEELDDIIQTLTVRENVSSECRKLAFTSHTHFLSNYSRFVRKKTNLLSFLLVTANNMTKK